MSNKDEIKEENWEEETIREIKKVMQDIDEDDRVRFIVDAIKQEKSELITKIEKEIEESKVLLHIDEKRGDNIGVEEKWGTGYNQAIDEVKQILNKYKV